MSKTADPSSLGESRHIAVKRFLQNERSLKKKDKLEDFNQALQEYVDLNHVEPVPHSDVALAPLLVHGIFKETSTPTKVSPVFDASAKTSTGILLNDTLQTGPNLYPFLTDVLIHSGVTLMGSAQTSPKCLERSYYTKKTRDLRRFLIRGEDGRIADHRMRRLMFGVKPSPFLATKVIQHLAERHVSSHPESSSDILRDFYVDDYLSEASTVEEAQHPWEQICQLLNLAGMKFREWRSSSNEFRKTIPSGLIETEDLLLPASDNAPKALGMHWDVSHDYLHVSTITLEMTTRITKRLIASESAKVFDVLGLFSPATIQSKVLLQCLW